MDGNATSTYRNAALLSLAAVTPDRVTTSAELDGRLAPVLERLRLPTGLLERIAGVHERRNWAEGESFDSATIEAGEKALAEAIERAARDAAHRSRQGALARARAERFTVEAMAAGTAAAYRTAMARRGASPETAAA